MRSRHPVSLAALAAASLVLAAGCGGTTGSESAGTPATTAAPATTAPTTAAPAQVKEEVKGVYSAFFDGFKADPSLLEDGAAMKGAIQTLQAVPAAATVTLDIKDVKQLDAAACDTAAVASPCAEVKYDLVVGGNPVVKDQTGYAVQQGGKWLVAKTTLCSLAGLGGNTPKEC